VLPKVTTVLSKSDRVVDPARDAENEEITRNVGDVLLNSSTSSQSIEINPEQEPTGTTASSTLPETQTSPEDAYISVEEEMNYDDEMDEAFLISGDQNAGDDINIGEELFDEMFEEIEEDSGFCFDTYFDHNDIDEEDGMEMITNNEEYGVGSATRHATGYATESASTGAANTGNATGAASTGAASTGNTTGSATGDAITGNASMDNGKSHKSKNASFDFKRLIC
jgi:hypothetical protein